MTTDIVSAKTFYGELFGWEAKEMPAGEAGGYAILSLAGGKGVFSMRWRGRGAKGATRLAGSPTLASRTPTQPPLGHTSRGIRCTARRSPSWMDYGRMAVIQDPTDAVLAAWEPRVHIGADRVNDPSCLTWNERAPEP